MKNKELFTGLKGKGKFKGFQALQYWIAAVSYLIIFSLSILYLVNYCPMEDELRPTRLIILIIIIFVIGTLAFGWEMLQWRKKRVKKEQPSLEDIIKDVNKDSSNSD